MLVTAGVEEQVIYEAANWPAFVKALRPGDRAAVADLRIFGSRKALVAAVAEVEAQQAKLVVIESGTEIHAPTLREVDRTLTRWRGEAGMKSSKRASALASAEPRPARSRSPQPLGRGRGSGHLAGREALPLRRGGA
jgi:hypothetical protein